MPNPFAIAAKGKGPFALVQRAQSITRRYGFTAAKMDRALRSLSDVLNQFDAQGSFPVTSVALARNGGILEKYQAQGIEFAVHGLVHVDHTQLSLAEQHRHFKQAQQIFNQAGIRFSGFRCPYLRWNPDTLTALGECGFAYDSSQALAWDVVNGLETDPYLRVLDFYGAQMAAAFPALPRIAGSLVRIPYCVPDDEALVERLQLADGSAMAEIWLAMLERIYEAGELFTIGLHPERAHVCQEPLRATLARARSLSPKVWVARLDEIAAWWRTLREATFEVRQEDGNRFQITVTAPAQGVVLARDVAVEAATQPGPFGFQQVLATEFSFKANKRPFIGLAPDTSPALRDFLQQQGYLVEMSTDARDYAFYLNQANFAPEDERQLLTEIEVAAKPLIRLGRWPEAAQCALSITGDIDAFTLWDYGQRLRGG